MIAQFHSIGIVFHFWDQIFLEWLDWYLSQCRMCVTWPLFWFSWWLLLVSYWFLFVTALYLVVTGGYCSLLVVTARYRSLLLVPTFSMNDEFYLKSSNHHQFFLFLNLWESFDEKCQKLKTEKFWPKVMGKIKKFNIHEDEVLVEIMEKYKSTSLYSFLKNSTKRLFLGLSFFCIFSHFPH